MPAALLFLSSLFLFCLPPLLDPDRSPLTHTPLRTPPRRILLARRTQRADRAAKLKLPLEVLKVQVKREHADRIDIVVDVPPASATRS